MKSYGNIVAPTYYKENIVKISGKKLQLKVKEKNKKKQWFEYQVRQVHHLKDHM